MPEIAEVGRIVHFLRKHAVGKTIETIKSQEDDIVYGKVGTSASAFQKALTGKKIIGARQQGKYFWLEMDSPPHPLMHFGMSGWMKFNNDDTAYYRPVKAEESEWPPKFWKFILQFKEEPKNEVAFIDARRLGRIRLIDVPADQMRKTTPLKENGPDPVLDKDILTVEWLGKKLRSKKVPVKALLLDQANISGIGNWVGDEIMYHAKLHPEQYSNTFSDEQIKRLHDSMMYVCDTAMEALGDSDAFPKDWLMKHRWTKGKATKLPTGEKITFLKVGGRTSAIVPSVQKKTAAVAGDVLPDSEEEQADEVEPEPKPKRAGKRKAEAVEHEEATEAIEELPIGKKKRSQKKSLKKGMEEAEEEIVQEEKPTTKSKTTTTGTTKGAKKPSGKKDAEEPTRARRSGRLTK